MQISKSEYMLFLKHPAWFWLKKHDKDKLPPVSAETQAIFDAGNLFEAYAEKLLPDAVKIGFDKSDFRTYKTMPAKTKKAIESKAKTILQGRLEKNNITCIFDAIVRVDSNKYDLYEIKSSNSAKNEHEYDLAFQVEVFTSCGYRIDKVFVIHCNSKFIKRGEVKPKDLCKITNVTKKVRRHRQFTKYHIKKAFETLKLKDCPDLNPAYADPGAFSDWLSIYKTMAEIDEYSIYNLISPGGKIDKLEALGIKQIADIPDEFDLNERQKNQVQSTKHDGIIINHDKINEFLAKAKYPLYFLDYETLSSVVPYFDGLGPHKQLPFQFSLHVKQKPDGKLEHFEYLHNNNLSPVKPLTEKLISHIGTKGTVFVWFQNFEKSCNQLMVTIEPEYKDFYDKLNKRILDLMTPFANSYYVHKNFFGSASIKKVLPVLIPELSYKDLDIQEGLAASRLWMEAVLHNKHPKEKEKILSDLQKYCELDTLAMVRIYEFLKNIK